MAFWIQLIIIWVVVCTVVSFITRRRMAKYYIEALKIRDEEGHTEPYQRGFKDGALGVKMYYTILDRMPSSHWIDSNCTTKMDSREKILATLTEEERDNLQE